MHACANMPHARRRIGVIGFGSLGRYLVSNILQRDELELAFVWDKDHAAMEGRVADAYILSSLDEVSERQADLVVEVAHPDVTVQHGGNILQFCDYMMGSPAALAQPGLEEKLRISATDYGLYVPSGAFWGSEDIRKMADRGNLQSVNVS